MRVILLTTTVITLLIAVYLGQSAIPEETARALQEVVEIPEEEAVFHTPPGATGPGTPAQLTDRQGVLIRLKTVDADSGNPIAARLNVIGPDGRYYEPDPDQNTLSTYSLHRTGNRNGKGPFRYFGWFFYSPGESEIRVPPGTIQLEAWKGLEYQPIRQTLEVSTRSPALVTLRLKRVSSIRQHGYFSGDTHLHFVRDGTSGTDRLLFKLLAAEDIHAGFILAMNAPESYSPRMTDQIWPQTLYGNTSIRQRGNYHMISSQEYRANTYGHILMLAGEQLVQADGLMTDPNNWPVFGLVADELHQLGGFAFHAHGGYAKGIYGDVPQQKTDGVELLQFAEYRGIGIEGWYHILNAGYRFPGIGASDYPYCRALGDCRTYVRIPGELTVKKWIQGAAAGNSFFTNGPLLRFEVNRIAPGGALALHQASSVTANLNIESPVVPVTDIEVIQDGRVLKHAALSGKGPWNLTWNLPVEKPGWIAARAYSKDSKSRPDAEAHTNPIYIQWQGKEPRNTESIMWLMKKLEERIEVVQLRNFAEKQKVLDYFHQSHKSLRHRLDSRR